MGAAPQLPLSTILNVSVALGNLGANAYNTSNLAIFTSDTPGTNFPASGYQIYLTPAGVAADWGSSSVTTQMADAVFNQKPNILAAGGTLIVIPLQASETLAAAITRTSTLVQYFGCMSAAIESQADLLAAAAVAQGLNKILFAVQYDSASVAPGGALDLLRSGSLTQTRGLYYGDSTGSPGGINALLFQAAYAGRGLSVDFNGSKTTLTMQLKSLAGIQPDPTMTPTLYTQAMTAGADVYPSFQGDSSVASSGANDFFDNQYNLQWLAGAIQIAAFNFLAQTSTKVPQTEEGMDAYKAAIGQVLEQAKTNGMCAPGAWNSSTTFGNQAKFLANIQDVGYYMYSVPLAQQAQSARAARQAPPVQVALKYAGAVHSGNVIVNVNP